MSSPSLSPSVISHVSLGTNDYPHTKAFYDAVLATLQIGCVMELPAGAGYGRAFPEFWVQRPHDGGRASVGNGTHTSFLANSIDEVKAFHAKALEMGATDEGVPGLRPHYDAQYYAAFVRDLDGHKIKAMPKATLAARTSQVRQGAQQHSSSAQRARVAKGSRRCVRRARCAARARADR